MKNSIILTVILLLIALTPIANAEVIIFDNYKTTINYDSGKLLITKELRLKNVGPTPIIPGEIHFKISEADGKKTKSPEITNFKAVNKYGKELEIKQIKTEAETDLVFTIWDPLLPDFFYDVTMSYEIKFDPSGILFHHIVLPEEKTTIPIKNSVTELVLPKKYHVTYAPDAEVKSTEQGRIVAWVTKEDYQVEYSVMPFPKTGVKAVNIFWLIIILLFLTNLILRIKKKSRQANQW